MTDERIIETLERENITLAPLKKRVFALMIDEILLSIIFGIIFWNFIPANAPTEEMIRAAKENTIYIVLLKIIYQAFFVWYYGATPGKLFLKIRVLSTNNMGNPNLIVSLTRAIVRIVSENFLFLGFAWAFYNPKRETWHDKIAKTLVVNVY